MLRKKEPIQLCYVSHPWAKKQVNFQCEVEIGRDNILLKEKKTIVETEIPPSLEEFCGNCYICGGSGHSKNYCPLRRCEICKSYGHGSKTCSMSLKIPERIPIEYYTKPSHWNFYRKSDSIFKSRINRKPKIEPFYLPF